ncbi:unnamed protein product [Vitrella brassicaformis CCMP3155]|uniref:Uncharacterized protein n=1 Tax=Vitrella brassicaformis (strain CCMP3155) TaxID=1169540 RepID=A0A0G4GKV8_VITBC|nr:unnamed protein product [Vitrella brassicaformis CCMP3155]|eukprot:CEM30663.1 unnamed protein product [Vitrella brassicaformis CCMP3155]
MRARLPPYRQLTDNQQFHIVDRVQNKRYDAVTLFDVRPPKIHFINNIEEYVKWCAISSSTRTQINQGLQEDVAASPLLDGALNVVKIRRRYLHVAITAHERLPAQIVQDGVQLSSPSRLIEPLAALDVQW